MPLPMFDAFAAMRHYASQLAALRLRHY